MPVRAATCAVVRPTAFMATIAARFAVPVPMVSVDVGNDVGDDRDSRQPSRQENLGRQIVSLPANSRPLHN